MRRDRLRGIRIYSCVRTWLFQGGWDSGWRVENMRSEIRRAVRFERFLRFALFTLVPGQTELREEGRKFSALYHQHLNFNATFLFPMGDFRLDAASCKLTISRTPRAYTQVSLEQNHKGYAKPSLRASVVETNQPRPRFPTYQGTMPIRA